MARTVLTYIFGSIILGALIFGARRILNPAFIPTRTITTDVIQGILVGIGLAWITLVMIGNAYITKVNGWTTMFGCSEPATASCSGPPAMSYFLAQSTHRKKRCTGRQKKMAQDTL